MIELLEKINLKDFTVIVPSVCVGNVGQLAADLLIFSLNLQKLGYVWHPSVLMFFGPDPFGTENSRSLGCELFYSASLKLIVFQIRTGLRRSSEFNEYLTNWLKNNCVKQVVVLAGSSAHERSDKQLCGEPLRYIFCPLTASMERVNAKNRNWVEYEKKNSENETSYIPGSGFALKLFSKCQKLKIPCSILLEFCTDGDNIPDALKLVDYTNEWLQLKEKSNISNWSIPPSWNMLFGSLPPIDIFN